MSNKQVVVVELRSLVELFEEFLIVRSEKRKEEKYEMKKLSLKNLLATWLLLSVNG